MCGKFTQMASWAQVVEFSRLLPAIDDQILTATPMRLAHVIHLGADGERVATPMRWGFVDKKPGARDFPRHMHARSETIERLQTFSDSFENRRGILLVHTFNEGEEVDVTYDDGEPAGRKWTRQWVVAPGETGPLALAVIFEPAMVQGRELDTFVQITTPANAIVSRITDRMPAILQPDDWEVWLGETRAPMDEVKALLRTFDDGGTWSIAPEDPTKKPPLPRNPKPRQGGLF